MNDTYKDLTNEQEEYLNEAEECGLTVKNVNAEKVRDIFEGSEEQFEKFEDLGLTNPFGEVYIPDRSDEE